MIAAGAGDLLDGLLDLASPWAYLLVALLAGLEGAALVGLVLPGEAAMLLGGVLTANGRAELGVMMAAASAGAVIGDSLGYALGRRFGGPIRRSRLGRRIGEERWKRAEDYVRDRGGRAVFVARFVGILRALVPAIAGMTRMPYRTFLPYNAAGGVLWTCGFVLAGHLAAGSYEQVARVAGQAGLLLLAIVVLVGAIALVARWIARHPERVTEPLGRLWNLAAVQRLASRYERQVAFLVARLRPEGTLGLLLTAQLALLIALGVAFGAVLEDVIEREELSTIDAPVARFVAAHREPWLTSVFEITTWAGSLAVLIPLVILAGLGRRRAESSKQPLVILAATLAGATALSSAIKLVVARPRPEDSLVEAAGYAFPSGHATAAAATWLALAVVVGRGATANWGRRVRLVAAALVIAVIVGLSRVYLGVHAATDVLGGWALGGLWFAAVLTTVAVLDERRAKRSPGLSLLNDQLDDRRRVKIDSAARRARRREGACWPVGEAHECRSIA